MDNKRVMSRANNDTHDSSRLSAMALFRPPVHRNAIAVLDRALFSKIIPIAAARVTDRKHIAKCRTMLEKSRDLLQLERLASVQDDPDPALASTGGKCLLLQPEINPEDSTTWSPILQQAVATKEIGVVPYTLQLGYDHWTYLEIMKAILPEDSQDEIPVGFSIVGHVAHLNLRSQYLPYKSLIAAILLDKNPTVRTVINKTTTIDDHEHDSDSVLYRTFGYEVLAGPDDMDVEVREGDCVFRFDYGKVYWNSRLNTEHKRLVDLFRAGDVVVDVMAGVGPFAVPAGKKGVFVWANDLNPDSYAALKDAVVKNKVEHFVRPFNLDGHAFISYTADQLLQLNSTGTNAVTIPPKVKRSRNAPPSEPPRPSKVLTIPPTISHFVMNLPSSAISFLPAFRGLYAGHESLFEPQTETKLPMVHVHCFSTKSDDNAREGHDICERISTSLGVRFVPTGTKVEETETEVDIYDVRDVAPLKRMFCASFRLPTSVAFAKREERVVSDTVVHLAL